MHNSKQKQASNILPAHPKSTEHLHIQTNNI